MFDVDMLKKLESMVVHEKDLEVPMGFFFEEIGSQQGFIDLGEKGAEPLLLRIVVETARAHFGPKVKVRQPLFTRLREPSFVHGTVILGGRLTTVLYFDRVMIGMMCVLSQQRNRWKNDLFRFSGFMFSGAEPPSFAQ